MKILTENTNKPEEKTNQSKFPPPSMETIRIHAESPPLTTHLLKSHEDATAASAASAAADLDATLRSLETFFCLFGFYHSLSPHRFLLSWGIFLLMGVLLPILIFNFYYNSSTVSAGVSRIVELDISIPITQALMSAASLLCISHNLRKYGMGKLLFVDKRFEELGRLHSKYMERIKEFYILLSFWILPCIIVKTGREIVLFFHIYRVSWLQSVAILLASVVSWTHMTTVFLSGCSLFSLMCSLQVVNFGDYVELLESNIDVSVLLEEHMKMCFHLSKISHRFRMYLLLVFFISVASQFINLLWTTQYGGAVDFINAGDFVVCSAVQVIGIVVCLNAATKISHRAQSVASVASRWHALTTCKGGCDVFQSIPIGNMEGVSTNQCAANHLRRTPSDVMVQSSHPQRQALVMYLQSNNGGITIYGWSVDRGLINTIVCIELSLLLFIFGGTL